MRTKSWKLMGLLLVAGLGSWLLLRWYINRPDRFEISRADFAQAARSIGRTPIAAVTRPEPLPPKRLVRIAIGSLGLPEEQQNGAASDLLIARLSGTPGIEMVERQALESILQELSLSLSRLVRAGDAVRAGKLLRADWFLLGTPMRAAGTNCVVVRLVDAHTGIFRNTTVLSADDGPEKISAGLARFIRSCRADATAAKAPVYLGIGAFNDLSLNNRLAAFPTQLRAYLMAAYRGGSLTMLEREHVEALLQELRLDLAGLTEGGGKDAPVMQTAVWLVEADYQSYDNVRPEVEVALRISRIFGRSTALAPMRQSLGEPLFRGIKDAIDHAINAPEPFPMVTRLTEVRAQMSRGRELSGFSTMHWHSVYQELTDQEAGIQQRRLQEAVRAFQTVLLLDATNREAKVCLADCYCSAVINRTEEGRQLLREAFESPVEDFWHKAATECLLATFTWSTPDSRVNWFSNAEKQTGNPKTRAFYHDVATRASEEGLRLQGAEIQPDILAEKKLRADITSGLGVLEGKSGTMNSAFGMDDYVDFFRLDKVEAGRKLAALLPRLISEFPMLEPHLTADALSHQCTTSNPVLPAFERQLESCRAHPERVFAPHDFWSRARFAAYDWCMENGRPDIAANILEGAKEAARLTNSVTFDAGDDMALAYAYKAAGKWQQALALFESYGNVPVQMSRGSGPWGRAFLPVLTSKEAALCRRKLGLTVNADPREFDMETNGLAMRGASAFAADPDGLWLAVGGELLQLDFGLRTNLVHRFASSSPDITCLLVGSSNVWIGTDGAGLFEFDKATRQVRQYGEKDGLLNDVIRTLCLADGTLWIAYGIKSVLGGYDSSRLQYGGLGLFDLSTRQFRSFMPSLAAFAGQPGGPPPGAPPRRIVDSLACGRDGEVWFAASDLRRFRVQANSWDSFPQVGRCATVAANSHQLIAAAFWNFLGAPQHGPPGISVLDLTDNHWSQLKDFGVLPAGVVTALTLEGDELWVGGMGFIAKISPQQNELRKYAYVRAYAVEKIEIGGGFLWAQYDGQLHHARLP